MPSNEWWRHEAAKLLLVNAETYIDEVRTRLKELMDVK